VHIPGKAAQIQQFWILPAGKSNLATYVPLSWLVPPVSRCTSGKTAQMAARRTRIENQAEKSAPMKGSIRDVEARQSP
jgi:hypothetical protein